MNVSRIGAVCGILAAVLIVAGMFVAADTPNGDAADAEWSAYIDDNESAVLARAYLLVAGGLALIGLYSFGIAPYLRNDDVSDRSLAGLAAGATVVAAAALGGGGLVGAAVGAAQMFGDVTADPALARLFDNFFYGLVLVGGGLPLAVLMAVVAIQTWRGRSAFARWVAVTSAVGTVGMLVAVMFLPFVLLPVWLVAVSVALFTMDEGRVVRQQPSLQPGG